MAQVSSPNPSATYHEGKGNQIISLTEVKHVMVKYTDPDGKESMALCAVFGETPYGKNGGDKMVGVWVLANLQQLQAQLRLAPKEIARKAIAMMEEKGILREGRVASADSAPAPELPDLSDVFANLDKDKGGESPTG